MRTTSEEFFDYFPASPMVKRWGVHATAFGRVKVPPQSFYPPTRHPKGHHFAWEQGRRLHEYQLLYISRGRGHFESEATGLKTIREESIFILFPGVWHRYRPDPAMGWTERWIEFQGPEADRMRRTGLLDVRHPIHRVHASDGMVRLWEEAERCARTKQANFMIHLGTVVLQIVALLQSDGRSRLAKPRRMAQVVAKSQEIISQKKGHGVSPATMAREMGVGYSYYRRSFKQETGLSPKQYQMEIRHRQTKDLLRGTTLTIKEIAEKLGYHSPYHLSLDFSRRSGASPSIWRRDA